ncbi:Uncharacterized protein Fot_53505 [Forsythia ovata]|uniref:Uncharacterized protein n=1 Tax=Forsythia ovata TaxID=205694 RepID=A0ABD1PIV3_9LAMI
MRVEEDGNFFSPNDVVVPLPVGNWTHRIFLHPASALGHSYQAEHVQTPELISGGRNGRGSRDARKVRKWGLKIAVNRSELEEEMGGFGGRAGGRRRGSRDARKVRKWGRKSLAAATHGGGGNGADNRCKWQRGGGGNGGLWGRGGGRRRKLSGGGCRRWVGDLGHTLGEDGREFRAEMGGSSRLKWAQI